MHIQERLLFDSSTRYSNLSPLTLSPSLIDLFLLISKGPETFALEDKPLSSFGYSAECQTCKMVVKALKKQVWEDLAHYENDSSRNRRARWKCFWGVSVKEYPKC